MPFQTRSSTLTATAWSDGIRVYTQSGHGDIREGCNNRSLGELDQAAHLPTFVHNGPFSQSDDWFCGQLHGSCEPGSTLCTISWGNTWNLSLLYQTHHNTVHEMRHDSRPDWYMSDFVQPDAMKGTDMAEVHSSNADKVLFFFQDKEGWLCYRRARNWHWESAVRLRKAATASAITATTWNETNDIRVYFQEEDNIIREYCGSFDGKWSLGQFTSSPQQILGTMAAVSWAGPQIRVYMQDKANSIIEWSWTGNWSQTGYKSAALPNTDIAAFVRNSSLGMWIHVYWSGPDKILHQRVNAPRVGWLEQTPIGFLAAPGHWAGSMSGTYFTDNDAGIDHKKIRKVKMRSGVWVDAFCMEFVDGSSTPWRGGSGGVPQEFVLNNGEDITQVHVCSNGSVVQKICFATSTGRQSIWFGIEGQRPNVWQHEGKALAGFSGASAQFINGLQPLWSERQSQLGPGALNQLIGEAKAIENNIASSERRNNELTSQVDRLHNSLVNDLHAPAESAVNGISILARSIEELSRVSIADNKALVAKCKGQSIAVAAKFEALHGKVKAVLATATQLATDITYQEATTQSSIKRVGEIMSISQAMRTNSENVRKLRMDQVADAQDHVRVADEKTRRDAENNRSQAKKARTIRDIFTLGLGELGDWGGLNQAIDYANKLITSANANLAGAQTGLASAQSGLLSIDAELRRFSQLKSALERFGPTLSTQAHRMQVQVKRISDLENEALNTGVFMSSLAGKASTLSVQHTARQLAASVLAIEAFMGTTTKLTGAIASNPESMDVVLKAIASSAVEPSPADDMI